MADPTPHDVSTHPCAHCGGPRVVAHMEWRSPAYWVTCAGCSNTQGGDSLEEAVAAWDAANPMREVSAKDEHAVACMILQSQLTPHVLSVVTQALDAFAASGLPQDLATFAQWLDDVAAAKGVA
jgi:hypothetical protein